MRLIDADLAIEDARKNYGDVYDAVNMEKFLKAQPTVDAESMAHAYWEVSYEEVGAFETTRTYYFGHCSK